MGRLIDAETLKQELYQQWFMDILLTQTSSEDMFYALAQKIDQQPTAYDTDKVVEQLEEVLSLADKEKERCARENPLQFDSAKGYATGIFNALEIVKAGGVNA